MTDDNILTSSPIAPLIQQAVENFEQDIYANHAQIAITNTEIYLDFYYISPKPGQVEPQAAFVQRIFCPTSLAKGLATAIANSVATYEESRGVKLPLAREKQPNDKIVIWEE